MPNRGQHDDVQTSNQNEDGYRGLTSSIFLIFDNDEDGAAVTEMLRAASPRWCITSTSSADVAKSSVSPRDFHAIVFAQKRTLSRQINDVARSEAGNVELLMNSGEWEALPLVSIGCTPTLESESPRRRAGVKTTLCWAALTSESIHAILDLSITNWRLMRLIDMQNDQVEKERLNRANQRQFTQIFAHELLTPLAATQEFISLVVDETAGPINRQQANHLLHAHKGCISMKQTVDTLMTSSANKDAQAVAMDRMETELSRIASVATKNRN